MPFRASVRDQRFTFADLRELLAKATEQKSGDMLAGIAAGSNTERVAAKTALADVRLSELLNNPLVDPDADEVTRLILDSVDRSAFAAVASMTVGELREFLLDEATGEPSCGGCRGP
jgi:ethanolamine ammonia-lyase large subunit